MKGIDKSCPLSMKGLLTRKPYRSSRGFKKRNRLKSNKRNSS